MKSINPWKLAETNDLFVNLTPHTITFLNPDKSVLVSVEPSGQVARVDSKQEKVTLADGTPITINGIEVFRTIYGTVTGLPAPQPNTRFLVSNLVRMAVSRDDLYSPGEHIRDEKGQPIGCIGVYCNY